MVTLTNKNRFSRFDDQFPIYNWVYPVNSDKSGGIEPLSVHKELTFQNVRGRALYVHV